MTSLPVALKASVCNMSWSVLGADVAYTPTAVFHEIVDLSINAKPAAFERVKTATFELLQRQGHRRAMRARRTR